MKVEAVFCPGGVRASPCSGRCLQMRVLSLHELAAQLLELAKLSHFALGFAQLRPDSAATR